ncbi:MAG: hypothetical protein EZS28_045865, partial [Streblomastix strix]
MPFAEHFDDHPFCYLDAGASLEPAANFS